MQSNLPVHIFLNSQNFHELIRKLYEEQKEIMGSRFSLEILARKMDYKSKGHLSSILKGEKKLPIDKCFLLKNIFHLSGIQYNIVYHYCLIDHTDKYDERDILYSQLKIAKDEYTRRHFSKIPENINTSMFCYLYCSLGLLEKDIFSLHDVSELYHSEIENLKDCMDFLVELNVVSRVGDNFSLTGNHIRVDSSAFNFAQSLNTFFIEESLKMMNDWFHKKEEAMFESSIISVKKDDYLLFLEKYKRFIDAELVKLECKQGDQLVLVNTQICPISIKKKLLN